MKMAHGLKVCQMRIISSSRLNMFFVKKIGTYSIAYITNFLWKPQKKNPPLMAGPLRGGGDKGRAIKEKRIFFETFFFYFVAI